MNIQSLQELKNRALELTDSCQTLNIIFAEGAVRIQREDQIRRLRKMAIMIKFNTEKAESSEEGERGSAREEESKAKIAKLFISPLMGKGQEVFDKAVVARKAGRQHCFGNIVVCVGKGGLPDDVRVVSIAEIAREQNRPESAIELGMWKKGTILFKPDSFMKLVEAIVRDIRKGKLILPILPDHLIKPIPLTQIEHIKRVDA